MRTRRGILVCSVLALLSVPARGNSPAQESQTPVFRTGSDFVRVDMYPTQDGAFVADLRPEDVEVFEDGVRQRVVTFEHVNISAPVAGVPDGEDSGGSDPRSRVFIIFIDTHTTQLRGASALRLSLVRVLDRLLAPDDLVGLMTPDMVVADLELGRRDTVISNLANDPRWLSGDSEPARLDLTEFAWENCYSTPRGPSTGLTDMKARRNARRTIDALQDLVYTLRGMREERKGVLLVTGGWLFAEDLSRGGSSSAVETEACRDDRLELARMNFGDLLRDLTRAANRANVSFYPVSARRSVQTTRDMPAQMRQRLQQRDKRTRDAVRKQLQQLADATDGFADYDRDFERVGRRIVEDTSTYYLIGYQSSNAGTDNKYREITVKVNRPGVRVRARPGYGGEAPRLANAAAVVPRGPSVDARVVEALTVVERFDGLAPFWGRLSEWEVADPESGGAFWFVGEVAPHRRTEPGWRDGSIADVTVLDAGRAEVLTRTIEMKPDESTFALRVPANGTLPDGDYSLRVRLRPAEGDDLALQEVTRVSLQSSAGSLGDAVLWRRGVAGNPEYRQTADPRFRRTERLRLELPTASADPATVRVLDRLGRPLPIQLPFAERPDESDAFRWVVVETPLAGLAPAFYTIEVTQGDVSRLTTFQLVP